MLLKVPWRRGVGAGVTDAEVDTLAVSLHVLSPSKALAALRALVRARHLMDCLNVLGEIALQAERFTAGWTFEVFYLCVNISHVALHTLRSRLSRENFATNGAFIGDFRSFLLVAIWKTKAVLMIHESLSIAEDLFTSLTDQRPVMLGELAAGGACVLVDEHA